MQCTANNLFKPYVYDWTRIDPSLKTRLYFICVSVQPNNRIETIVEITADTCEHIMHVCSTKWQTTPSSKHVCVGPVSASHRKCWLPVGIAILNWPDKYILHWWLSGMTEGRHFTQTGCLREVYWADMCYVELALLCTFSSVKSRIYSRTGVNAKWYYLIVY